jgi:hypothetical protein
VGSGVNKAEVVVVVVAVAVVAAVVAAVAAAAAAEAAAAAAEAAVAVAAAVVHSYIIGGGLFLSFVCFVGWCSCSCSFCLFRFLINGKWRFVGTKRLECRLVSQGGNWLLGGATNDPPFSTHTSQYTLFSNTLLNLPFSAHPSQYTLLSTPFVPASLRI